MNKKLLLGGIGLLVLIAVVFAIGLRFSSSSRSVTKSLQDFVNSNQSTQKCIINNDPNYSGEVFVDKGRVRADIRHSEKVSHLILANTVATQWYDDSTAGLSISFSEVEAIDLGAKFNFICQNWVVDPKTFEAPPQNLYYPSKKMLDDYNSQNNKPECQVCSELQGDALATCRKQLNCS